MDLHLQALAAKQHHVMLRPQLLDAGYTDDEIARRRRVGEWVAVRRGAYMERSVWEALDDLGQHRALTVAVVAQLRVPAVPSHVSAAVMLGLRVWGVDLSVVHVTRTDLHASRLEAGVMHHSGRLPDEDLSAVQGITVTSPARTAVDVARMAPFEQAVVLADSALASMANNREQLLATLDRMRTWHGARGAGRVVEFADGAAESVGESRARVQFERIGLPRPQLQKVIYGPAGEVFRLDFYFEDYETVGEFDGQSKYLRFLRPGDSPADVVWREKRREDALRDVGLEVVRQIWVDLERDAAVRARFLAAFKRSRRRTPLVA